MIVQHIWCYMIPEQAHNSALDIRRGPAIPWDFKVPNLKCNLASWYSNQLIQIVPRFWACEVSETWIDPYKSGF